MTTETLSFDQLELGKPLLKALSDVGYEKPSPIQEQTIPVLLNGRDVLGQAQTGTGKTAAFALPALTQIDLANKSPQVLVLAPTRELAIQVAEAFKTYAAHLKGFHVLPVYGGQDYRVQTRALDRGVHVIVGTPGRIMDHMRRGNIKLHSLRMFTLDEADEMLRMGFIDDVEWILEKLPSPRQMALFSATMPPQIARIAKKYLNDPEVVQIEVRTQTADTIRQRFWPVSGRNKLDALTRILEAEEFDAMLIFVRTKTSTAEIAEKLEARGYAAAPLNGDIQQKQRERTVDQLKKGKLDIIVATDVAARGLDVARVSHVLNYDIPSDTEAYVHRIGRTGRAGRKGEAILFVAPREKRMKQTIERATGKSIDQMELPSTDAINKQRIERFKQRIHQTVSSENLSFYESLVSDYRSEHPEHTSQQVAAALALLLQGDVPFLQPVSSKRTDRDRTEYRDDRSNKETSRKPKRSEEHKGKKQRGERPDKRHSTENADEAGSGKPHKKKIPMENFRVEVGQLHDVKASNIVGAIANEAGLESQFIGTINIYDKYSTIELPEGMPKAIFKDLKKVWVCGQKLQITKLKHETKESAFDKPHDGRPPKKRPKRDGAKDSKNFSSQKRRDPKKPKTGHSIKTRTDTNRANTKRTETKKSGPKGTGASKPGAKKTGSPNSQSKRANKERT